jgi:glycosyltransferase involved in cell wall biosynthesis
MSDVPSKNGADGPKGDRLRVLVVTSEWPTPEFGGGATFVVRQVNFLRRAGIDVDVFAFRGNKKLRNYLMAWKRLQGQLKQRRYDLMHAQFGQSALLSWPKRVPLVVTFRGCELLGDKGPDGRTTRAGKILQRLCRMAAAHADAVIVVSEHMGSCLPSSIRPHVIPSGLDFDLLRCLPKPEARRLLGLPAADRLVLFVGSPEEPRKRYDLAHRAVAILNQALPAKLIVAWHKPYENIPFFRSACDVLAFTSLQEGSPNVVKEALACNLPVVSVAVADVPLRLRGISGCEVCADDRPETIAAALERVLRRGQRIQGREAVQHLDERLMTAKLIEIYRSVLAQGSDDKGNGLAKNGPSRKHLTSVT